MAAALVIAVALVALPGNSGAHPSALNTLTLDLVLDQAGLVLIDAAANRDSYANAPSPDERAALADQVLEALGIARDTAQVSRDSSLLYHEVGFTVSLHAAFANTDEPGTVRIDTGPLQTLAARAAGTLVLDVCRVDDPGLTLAVVGSGHASAPDPSSAGAPDTGRTDCRTWTLAAGEPSVVVMARAGTSGAPAPDVRERVTMRCEVPSEGNATLAATGPVAVPTEVLHARLTGPPTAPQLVAETVLELRFRNRTDLVVPSGLVGEVTLGGHDGPRATRRLRITRCNASTSGWTASRVRIWVDLGPACVPIVVRTDRTSRTVRLAVGAPCA